MNSLKIETKVVQRVHDYWCAKRVGDRLPRRADIRPEELKDLLPYLFLVNVAGPPIEFVFRLTGTAITQWAGRDYTGATLNERDFGSNWRQVFEDYETARRTRRPCHSIGPASWQRREFLLCERIVTPLSNDGVTVDMLFGALCVIPQHPSSS